MSRRKTSHAERRLRPPLIHRRHQGTELNLFYLDGRDAMMSQLFDSGSHQTAFYERWNKRVAIWRRLDPLFFLFFASPLFSLCLFSPPSDSTKNLFHKTRRWVGPFEGISLSFFGSFLITDLLLRLFESFYLRIEASLSVNASDARPLTLLWLFFVFLFFHTRLGLFVSLFCLSTLMNVFTPCGVGFYL